MTYTRLLRFQYPLIRGEDVMAVQRQLNIQGFMAGEADGLFGPSTEQAIKDFQRAHQLRADGLVGPATWQVLFSSGNAQSGNAEESLNSASPEFVSRLISAVDRLRQPYGFRNSWTWQLTQSGLAVNGQPAQGTSGEPETVTRVWQDYHSEIVAWSNHYGVPVELILSTICTESSGKRHVVREEPGFQSDDATPHKVSPGVMQTLISTAREALGRDDIDRSWLLIPGNSIQAGTAYIANQWIKTNYNPPLVACAYNAGGVYHNDGADNPWKLRQYPIGTGKHASRFVAWFNDCFKVLSTQHELPSLSYYRLLN